MPSIISIIFFAFLCLSYATLFNSNLTFAPLSFLKPNSKVKFPFQIPSSNRQYSNEPCQIDSNCASPRTCSTRTLQPCTSTDTDCTCADPNNLACSTSSDCLPNDRCYLSNAFSQCFSCNFEPSQVLDGSPADGGNYGGGGVCISVDALSHLDRSMPVYNRDRRASVLCDKSENCATSGHVVVFHGTAMTMTDYCRQPSETCARRVKLVNSPRMTLGLRVASNSRDLAYTAFAASRETIVEKFVVKASVRMGL